MSSQQLHVITGAFGYSGKYITARLLNEGQRVRTITQSPNRQNPFGGKVEAHPFNFDAPEKLVESLRGATVLYNTYWVRFNYQTAFQHSAAVENTRKLFDAAKRAGVERVVHISITNPSEDSPLEYFSGKAQLERALIESGLSYAILRPTVLFGAEDILVNNIAWTLRHLPVFGVFGAGAYRLQPIFVDDLAALAVTQGKSRENCIVNAIGPETFTYRELVRAIGDIIGARRPIVGVPPWFGYVVGSLISRMQGDVFITREEIEGLMRDLLYVDAPPAGQTKLTEWARAHAASLGVRYASELARRRDRLANYENL
ncbi:MAG: NAD-dependent epimerase/dehydratase family protein [Chloroflexi bacterium]|nr:NAD-dependent epimerase/dehydratase family protein [Chloroflexota bacterium]